MNLDLKQVKKVIGRWRKILQLEPYWNIKVQVRSSASEMSDGNQDSMACINVDLRYFIAEIEFNSAEINENELDAVVLHELLHIIMEPLTCSSGCGLGKKFEEMNSILCESTIERLLPGYLTLYRDLYKPKKTLSRTSKTKKQARPKRKCKRK